MVKLHNVFKIEDESDKNYMITYMYVYYLFFKKYLNTTTTYMIIIHFNQEFY